MRIFFAFLLAALLYSGAAQAQTIYVANTGSGNVTVIQNGATIATVEVGASPSGLAVTPDGDFVYVVNDGSSNVSVIRTSDNKVVDTITVGNSPAGAAVTVNGDFVYVTNSGSDNVSVIQTSDNKVVDTIDVGNTPIGIATTPTQAFVANVDGGNVTVIDLSTNKVAYTTSTGGIAESMPFRVATGPAFGEIVAFVANSGSNNVCIVSENGDRCADVGNGPTDVVACCGTSSTDGYAFSANQDSNTVSIINVFENKTVFTRDVGEMPTAITAFPDGSEVYVANMGSNTVSQLQRSLVPEWSVALTFDTGDQPVAIALMPDTDSDGAANNTDTDSDNDGITDDDETSGGSSAQTSSIAERNEDPNDPDGDGLQNERDLDSDGDCIPDHFEAGGGNDGNMDGLSDNFVDVDADGHHDEHDADQTGNSLPLPDTDGDGVPDYLDRDSDNDGRSDAREAGGLDADGDGLHDETVDLNLDGLADACHPDTGDPLPILDLNSNGTPDFLEAQGGGGSGCALSPAGRAPSFPLYLLIPAFILVGRFLRKRAN